MKRTKYLSLALTLALAGCAAPTMNQTRVFFSGTPSVQDVVPDQARILVTVTRENGYQVQAPSPFDYVSFTLKNSTFLNAPLTKGITLTPGQNAGLMFTALRPGAGYSLDLVLKQGGAAGTESGMSHADTITLTAGQTTTVNIVIGLDNRISVTYSDPQAPNHKWADPGHLIVTGGTLNLNTGFGSLSDEDIDGADISHMRVTLSSGLHTGGAVIDTLLPADTANFRRFTWDSTTTLGAFNPANLLSGGTGTVTFELITSSGAIVGRSEMDVTIFKGSSIDINLIDESVN